MRTDTSEMSARVVPLGSAEADDRRMGGTVAQRVAAVGELTRLAWTLAGRALPTYTRATMPIALLTLGADSHSSRSE